MGGLFTAESGQRLLAVLADLADHQTVAVARLAGHRRQIVAFDHLAELAVVTAENDHQGRAGAGRRSCFGTQVAGRENTGCIKSERGAAC